jgi:hypothetical protein
MDTCLICRGKTEIRMSTGDFRLVTCDGCGEYKISLTAVTQLAERDLSVAAMRHWLDEQRRLGASVPLIQSSNLIFE